MISQLYVVTTATCILRTPNGLKLTSVKLGEWDKSTDIDCDKSSGSWICNNAPVIVPIEKASTYENHKDLDEYNNNIGLIRLKHEVEYTDFIKPICVPAFVFFVSKKYLYDRMVFEIASWGETSPVGTKTDILLKVDLRGINCPNNSSYLCVQGTRKRNVCGGDEGAPIMGRMTRGNRKYVFLAGIVSSNNTCGADAGHIFLADTGVLAFLKPEKKIKLTTTTTTTTRTTTTGSPYGAYQQRPYYY